MDLENEINDDDDEFYDCEDDLDDLLVELDWKKKQSVSLDVLSIHSLGSLTDAQEELLQKEQQLKQQLDEIRENHKREDDYINMQLKNIKIMKDNEQASKLVHKQLRLKQKQKLSEIQCEKEYREKSLKEMQRLIDIEDDFSSRLIPNFGIGPEPDIIQSTKSKSLDRELLSTKDDKPTIAKSFSLPRQFDKNDDKTERSKEFQKILDSVQPDLSLYSSIPLASRNVEAVENSSAKAPETEIEKQDVQRLYLNEKNSFEQLSKKQLSQQEKYPEDDKIWKNPLFYQIMKRSDVDFSLNKDSDEDSSYSESSSFKSSISWKKKGITSKILSKLTKRSKNVEANDISESDEENVDVKRHIKIKASNAHRGPYDFDLTVPVQDLSHEHQGAIWSMKFSSCGGFLATGGHDKFLRVWQLKEHCGINSKFKDSQKSSTLTRTNVDKGSISYKNINVTPESSSSSQLSLETFDDEHEPFIREPIAIYRGHTEDILDISWSKNYFILSSSMDKTVRLWHITRKECLCCFQHTEFVSSIAFHPKDDRYFISGSLDGKLRLWNIPEKKVHLWNEVKTANNKPSMISAVNFAIVSNLEEIIVGTFDGKCFFYTIDQLKYRRMLVIKTSKRHNRKVTSIEIHPKTANCLITTNDSRIRLYDLRDNTLVCKYKGFTNFSSQIKAFFNNDGKYIISGSEDQFIYFWRTNNDVATGKMTRRDRNIYWESIRAHEADITSAIFAPKPELLVRKQFTTNDQGEFCCEAFVSADVSGCLKVFINKFKPDSDI